MDAISYNISGITASSLDLTECTKIPDFKSAVDMDTFQQSLEWKQIFQCYLEANNKAFFSGLMLIIHYPLITPFPPG